MEGETNFRSFTSGARRLTFGFRRNLALRFDRNDRRLQDFFVERRQLVEVVAILLVAGAPREVDVTDFRRDHGQVAVKSGITEKVRDSSILDREDAQRVAAEDFDLLLANPYREVGEGVLCLILVIVLVVMGHVVGFMSREDCPGVKQDAKQREHQKQSHYECLQSVKRKTEIQSSERSITSETELTHQPFTPN